MLNLFFTFFKIGLLTFGGGYAMIPMISEEASKFGITSIQISNFIAISESTPGPFAINIATFIGYDAFGILGAIFATLGVILPSFIIMMVIAMIINKIRDSNFFKIFMRITIPTVSGLILSSTLKIGLENLFNVTSIFNIVNDFSINLLTVITLSVLIVITLTYYFIKKKKPSPFLIIIISIIIGVIANIIHFIKA